MINLLYVVAVILGIGCVLGFIVFQAGGIIQCPAGNCRDRCAAAHYSREYVMQPHINLTESKRCADAGITSHILKSGLKF